MREIILVRSNSNLAAHFRSIVLAATCLLVVAAGANGGTPAANTNNPLTATDVHGVRQSCPVGKPPGWLADAVEKPDVQYPEWGKNHHEQGMGVFRMSVDSKTGKVTTVSAVKSTGFRDLDDSAIAALGRWRWKPGTWKETDVAINFQLGKGPGALPQAGLWKDLRSTGPRQGSNMPGVMPRGGGRY
jgi:TonB family protein